MRRHSIEPRSAMSRAAGPVCNAVSEGRSSTPSSRVSDEWSEAAGRSVLSAAGPRRISDIPNGETWDAHSAPRRTLARAVDERLWRVRTTALAGQSVAQSRETIRHLAATRAPAAVHRSRPCSRPNICLFYQAAGRGADR